MGIIEVGLLFRFILKMLAANPVGFVNFVYSVTNPLALPFYGIFGRTVGGQYVIEWTTLVTMAVYALVAWGIVHLFQLVKPTTPQEVEENV